MRNLPIDSTALRMLATGGVQPVAVWAELSDGSRKAVPDLQEKNEHGVPLWTVEAMVPAQTDRDRAEIISVRVASHDRPNVAEFAPVVFEGLVCSVSVNKRTGALGQYWGAERVADARPVKNAA
jgi:hypothetical protein